MGQNVNMKKITDKKPWKTKPIVVFDNALMNDVFIEKVEKLYQIHYSSDLCPFSCFFPLSSASFIMVDFEQRYKTGQRDQDKEWIDNAITPLVSFAKASTYPNIVFLAPQIGESVLSTVNEIQRCVEHETGNVIFTGFATSWKAAANYILDVAKKLSLRNLQLEDCNQLSDTSNLLLLNEKAEKRGKIESVLRMGISNEDMICLTSRYPSPSAVIQEVLRVAEHRLGQPVIKQ